MNNEQLSPNFTRAEFACKGKNCCDKSLRMSMRTVLALEAVRAIANKKKPGSRVIVTSGCRCPIHNKRAGGMAGSRHMANADGVADAADITIDGFTGKEIAAMGEQVPEFRDGGIGTYSKYPDMCHLDTRPNGPARWAE